VRERFAGLLMSFVESYGVHEPRGIRLDIKLTREEMAAMIGTTVETLVRLITEFKNEGIVVQEQKVIYIINQKKLIEFANV
jgi:CRP-like cAMP-binding protein